MSKAMSIAYDTKLKRWFKQYLKVLKLNLYIQVIDSKKPTMSEIVKSGDSELSNSTTVEVQESRSSPKPIGPVKTVTPQLTKVITVLCKNF